MPENIDVSEVVTDISKIHSVKFVDFIDLLPIIRNEA